MLLDEEIEEAIARHPGVFHVAVVAVPHPRLGEEPVAFLTVAPKGPDDRELAGFALAEGLAPYKVPRTWVRVARLPRTSSGKVKKHELIDMLPADAGQDRPPSDE